MVVGTWNSFTQSRGTMRSEKKGPNPLLVLKCHAAMMIKVSSNKALLQIPSPEAAESLWVFVWPNKGLLGALYKPRDPVISSRVYWGNIHPALQPSSG